MWDGHLSHTDNGHYWNRQQTLDKWVVQWKILKNGNVGALQDSKLHKFQYFEVFLQFADCIPLRF